MACVLVELPVKASWVEPAGAATLARVRGLDLADIAALPLVAAAERERGASHVVWIARWGQGPKHKRNGKQHRHHGRVTSWILPKK